MRIGRMQKLITVSVVLGIFAGFVTPLSAKMISPNYDPDYEAKEMKILERKLPLVLQCNVTASTDMTKFQIAWTKDGEKVEPEEGRISIVSQNNSLVILYPNLDDIGTYKCTLNNSMLSNDVEKSRIIHVVMMPRMKSLSKSYNLVEGDKLRLHCEYMFGAPEPNITWYRDGSHISEYNDTGRIFMYADEKDIQNAILEIEDLELTDRATYACVAMNDVGQANTTTLVRVKEKLAALWPFLGIVAEVAVLCTIIFIYEKRRNKGEMEESDTDQSPDMKNTADHNKDSEVRQRK